MNLTRPGSRKLLNRRDGRRRSVDDCDPKISILEEQLSSVFKKNCDLNTEVGISLCWGDR
ncbi:hypothetical protein HAX54_013873, partial [Datura stramonium]|nr:hypothetical protein [Datura stramonium]